MNATDKNVGKARTTERQLAAVAGSDKVDEPLPKNLEGTSDQRKPVEWEDVLLGISHHLDDGTSERKAVNDRLLAMESEIKRRGSPGFTRYLLAICIGVAATLAWQSYGETTKQVIASAVQQLGWTKSPDGPESTAAQPSVPGTQVASVVQTVSVPKAPAAASIDPEQVHQMAVDLAALGRTVDQLAASQDQMVHQIDTLQTSNQEILTSNQQILTSNQEILEKIPAPPSPPPDGAPSHKPTTRTPAASR